jgi:alpha-beta hydrolase superfamily lysophospholipase
MKDMQRTADGTESEIVSVPYALALNGRDEKEYHEYRAMHPEMVSNVPLISVFNSFMLMKPLNHCADIRIPVLLIHGDADELVNVGQSESIRQQITAPCALRVVKNGPHPLPVSDQAAEVFKAAAAWFEKYL